MTENRMQDIIRSLPEELTSKVISKKVKGNEMWLEVPPSSFDRMAAHIHNLWGANIVTFHGPWITGRPPTTTSWSRYSR